MFRRGVYLAEHTLQAASVEFVPHRGQIMRAADCKNLSESPEGVFRQSEAPAFHRGLLCYVKFSFRLTSQWVRKYPPTATIRNSPAFHSIMEEKTSMPLD